eukprot:714061-Pyramimonas_sp.AAC.1
MKKRSTDPEGQTGCPPKVRRRRAGACSAQAQQPTSTTARAPVPMTSPAQRPALPRKARHAGRHA